ncbi:Mss4-like protein [Lasiosphaeria ovina]|uniref:Mss4-like protein n=1 Tax=Lasiosphaeria ovina TaxID=92902 RepID=A0AAE0KM81_9PEZI|nr:Mss4-like protein [Lasiosphaeria ovina]
MSAPYHGSCLCDGVRFTISSDPMGITECYCGHCRKGSGGNSQIMAVFAGKDVTFQSGQDLVATYTFTNTTSGKGKDKTFCKTCGAQLWTVPDAAKSNNLLLIRTSLLDEGLEMKPDNAIFTRTRPAWVPPFEGVENHEAAP